MARSHQQAGRSLQPLLKSYNRARAPIAKDGTRTGPRSSVPFSRSATRRTGESARSQTPVEKENEQVQRLRVQETTRVRYERLRGREPGHPDEDAGDLLL